MPSRNPLLRPRADENTSPAPRLVLRFAVYGAVAFVLAAGAALLLARHNASTRIEAAAWEDATYIADELGRDDLARAALQRRVTDDERALLDDLFGREALGRDVLRVSLFTRDGFVTYSTHHALVGSQDGVEAERARSAISGATVHGVFPMDGAPGGRVLASYVPVRWLLGDPLRPSGVLVVYRDYRPTANAIREDFLLQAGTLMGALLLLYVALLPIMRRVTTTLELRNRRLVQQADELRASESRYRALTEQASDGVLVCDTDGTLLEVNPALGHILGHPLEKLLTMNARDLISPDDLERLPLRFDELLAGKTVLQERALQTADGSRRIGEFSATLLEDGRIHASLRDVTARKVFEADLLEKHENEAVGRLATGVANDFAAMLDVIDSHSEKVLASLGDDDPLRSEVHEIKDATVWGASLIKQLLAFGRRTELKPEVIDVRELVERKREMLLMLLGERVDLVVDLPPGALEVSADPAQLEQVIVDLTLHARDAMPLGGTVTVQAAPVEFQDRKDGNGGRRGGGGFVLLAISDTGGERRRRDRPFESKGGEDELMGLGLAAVYGVVQQSGGSIGIESQPGSGTTVRVYLPRVEAAAHAGSRPAVTDAA